MDQAPFQMSNVQLPPASPPGDLWLGFNAYCDKLLAAKRAVGEWYNDGLDRGEALVMSGGYGCGKTHLARVVIHAYADPANSIMVSEADLIAQIRASYDGAGSEKMIISTLRRARLLILDDVGTAHVKAESQSWLEDIYWRLLDRRSEMHLGTLITTNLVAEQLGKRIGGRAYSRLLGMMNGRNWVDLFGVKDYRLKGWKRASS